MTEAQTNLIIRVTYFIGSTMVITGAIFNIQHYKIGNSILIFGFIIGSIAASYENYRLKERVKKLEEQINNKN